MNFKRFVKPLIVTLAIVFGYVATGSGFSTASASSVGKTITIKHKGAHTVKVTVTKDNSTTKVVKTYDTVTKEAYYSTYYKKTKKVVSKNTKGKTLYSNSASSYTGFPRPIAASTKGDFYLLDSNKDWTKKYKYYYYTHNIWVIQTPNEAKNCTETSHNSSNLESFRSSVNKLKSDQATFAGLLGGISASTALAIGSATTTLGWSVVIGILASIGLTGSALAKGFDINQDTKDLEHYFGRTSLK